MKTSHIPTLLCLLGILALPTFSQAAAGIPEYLTITEEQHTITTGGVAATGFYEETIVRDVYLEFSDSNYWSQLQNYYGTDTYVLANLTVDGTTYTDVGVQFKGFTSYNRIGSSQKKSFDIKVDYTVDGQDIMGYDTLNFNNCYEDPSFMREVIYSNSSTSHIPSAKGNFINLYINGENWGVYANIQQLNKEFLEQWFTDEDGPRWRAESSSSTSSMGRPGAGGGFGNGTSGLNYLGDEGSDYQPYYTLKTGYDEDEVEQEAAAWEQLATVCSVLNNTSDETLIAELGQVMDIDRALWFLAHEIIFGDDDGYVNKGGTDYCLYINPDTNRLTPLEYDGNSAFASSAASWSLFKNSTNSNYPLLSVLLNHEELRQRYLAHVRTILEETFTEEAIVKKMETYDALIRDLVSADPKKIYTYNNYLDGLDYFQEFVQYRRTYLLSDSELTADGVQVAAVSHWTNGIQWATPDSNQDTVIEAQIDITTEGTPTSVCAYYLPALEGVFSKIVMNDAGTAGDRVANDGIYSATLPAAEAGTYVRYYIETIADDDAGTRVYAPAGAEHNTWYYRVNPGESTTTASVVINEFMASNKTVASDEAGEFADWIELFNNSILPVSIEGWYLSDDYNNLDKWQFPARTLNPGEFLIVWADEDQEQGTFHSNFKLSADGEELVLCDADGQVIDYVQFGAQDTDISWARSPNGTGEFKASSPTFLSINP